MPYEPFRPLLAARGTTMTKTELTAAAAQIISTMNDNVASLKAAIEVAKLQPAPGFVFVWPQYWLGVYVTASKAACQAVAMNRATVTHKGDRRVFTNGHGEKAVLMPLREALDGALAHALAVQADMAERISKTA
jgi:hypothetical protein